MRESLTSIFIERFTHGHSLTKSNESDSLTVAFAYGHSLRGVILRERAKSKRAKSERAKRKRAKERSAKERSAKEQKREEQKSEEQKSDERKSKRTNSQPMIMKGS